MMTEPTTEVLDEGERLCRKATPGRDARERRRPHRTTAKGDGMMYALFSPQRLIVPCIGCFSSAKAVREAAGEGLMGVDDYYRLGSDSARWRMLYRKGYRVLPVRVLPSPRRNLKRKGSE